MENKPAPLFTLPDQDGTMRSLKDYRGKNVVLYFYPKDMTSGCTIEANFFSELAPEFEKLDTVILGVSVDDMKSHKKFCEKENLKITLLSDTEKQVVNAYGVWVEKSMYGRKYMGISRDTFLIGNDGTILRHFVKVKPDTHPQELLELIRQMK